MVRNLVGRDADEALDLAHQCVTDGIETLVVVGVPEHGVGRHDRHRSARPPGRDLLVPRPPTFACYAPPTTHAGYVAFGRRAAGPPSLRRQATTPPNRSLRSRFRGDPGGAIARVGRRSRPANLGGRGTRLRNVNPRYRRLVIPVALGGLILIVVIAALAR